MSGKPDPKAKKAPAAAKSAAKGASAVAKGDAAVPKKAHAPRNQKLPGGVWLFSRSKMFHKRGLFKVKHAPVPKEKRKRKKRVHVKKINGDNNGGKRVVHIKKERRSYPTEDSPKHKRTTHMKPSSLRIAKLRKRITPGTILILLAGPHRGKRVVFLKQLKTGLLMVTGPYGINGCPLRRINQIYVIATSTKIDISSVKLPENLDDRFFNRPKSAKRRSRKDEGEIFDTKPQVRLLPFLKKFASPHVQPSCYFVFFNLKFLFCIENSHMLHLSNKHN
ncbi:large ribosomal subunit protein eL6 isoform X2 [Rhipicephalus microplus]|uniref:large ribosomal subunit protein eL6 isoform X2 n=1 Tax=Rhipicephalus microplus TaxID=6941 RepID=UPI003F6CDD71